MQTYTVMEMGGVLYSPFCKNCYLSYCKANSIKPELERAEKLSKELKLDYCCYRQNCISLKMQK